MDVPRRSPRADRVSATELHRFDQLFAITRQPSCFPVGPGSVAHRATEDTWARRVAMRQNAHGRPDNRAHSHAGRQPYLTIAEIVYRRGSPPGRGGGPALGRFAPALHRNRGGCTPPPPPTP